MLLNNFTKYLACGVEVVEPVRIQGGETHRKDSCADCYHATIPLQGETGKSCAHVADCVKVLKLELRGVKEAIFFDMSKVSFWFDCPRKKNGSLRPCIYI